MEQIIAILMALGLIAFGLFLGLQAFTTLVEQARAWDGARRSKAWPAVDGVVEISKITWRGIRSPSAHPVVTYRYHINGVAYVGERINFSFARTYFTPEAETILARYPANSKVTVYYDPHHPTESTLEQRHTSILSGVMVGLVLFLPTMLCLASGLIGLRQTIGK
jgi:hypothetical protein